MHPVNNNYFNYTDTAINSLEVDSLSDTHYWVNPILGHLDIFFLHNVHKNGLFVKSEGKAYRGTIGKDV